MDIIFFCFDNIGKSRRINKFTQLITNLLIVFLHLFWKLWFSIISLFTLKSCYFNMIHTSACRSIAWNKRDSFMKKKICSLVTDWAYFRFLLKDKSISLDPLHKPKYSFWRWLIDCSNKMCIVWSMNSFEKTLSTFNYKRKKKISSYTF